MQSEFEQAMGAVMQVYDGPVTGTRERLENGTRYWVQVIVTGETWQAVNGRIRDIVSALWLTLDTEIEQLVEPMAVADGDQEGYRARLTCKGWRGLGVDRLRGEDERARVEWLYAEMLAGRGYQPGTGAEADAA